MSFKYIKFLVLVLILTLTFGGCNLFTPATSEGVTSGNTPEFIRPEHTPTKNEVVITVTDEALYNDYLAESLPVVIERVSGSVVQIIVEVSGVLNNYSGVVIGNSTDLKYSYIVTCHHAIVGASRVDVVAKVDEQIIVLGASPIGTDPQTNLCVIRVEEKLAPATFYSSALSKIKAGESIITASNALATDKVVSSLGIVSATDYQIDAGEGKSNTYMLTDAFINANSAGGGAFTAEGGFLAGIIDNTASGKNNWQGFIIPSNVVESVCTEIIREGVVLGRYKLGITVTDSLTAWGVYDSIVVTSVSQDGSIYANGAGLRVGDVIRGIGYAQTGDVYPASANDLYEYLYNVCEFKVGDKITFFIERNNTNDSITITISQYDYFTNVGNR